MNSTPHQPGLPRHFIEILHSNSNSNSNSYSNSTGEWWGRGDGGASAAAAAVAGLVGAAFATSSVCISASDGESAPDAKPLYRKSEIAQHNSKEKGVWVTYGTGVYDITNFIVNHPGGQDKILLAAGQAVEPFWSIYRQHYNSKLPGTIMPGLLIGYIHPDDVVPVDESVAADDPYKDDPVVSPVHVFHQRKPVNSEAPSTLMSDSWITPEHYWFKRNHHPVPQVTPDTYRLTVTGLGIEDLVLSLEDLKTKFKKTTVVSAIQCGGNRRSEMNNVAITAGSPWGTGAISNAEWSGVRLRDVLKAAAVGGALDEEELMRLGARHVQFAALEGLEASIPLHKAVSLCTFVGAGPRLRSCLSRHSVLTAGRPTSVVAPTDDGSSHWAVHTTGVRPGHRISQAPVDETLRLTGESL